MAQILRKREESEQALLILETASDEGLSSDSKSDLYEDMAVGDNNIVTGS
jgi:hypothetical protein